MNADTGYAAGISAGRALTGERCALDLKVIAPPVPVAAIGKDIRAMRSCTAVLLFMVMCVSLTHSSMLEALTLEDLPESVWSRAYLESQATDPQTWLGFSRSALDSLSEWEAIPEWIPGSPSGDPVHMRILDTPRFVRAALYDSDQAIDTTLVTQMEAMEMKILDGGADGNLAAALQFHSVVLEVAFKLICLDAQSSNDRSAAIECLDRITDKWRDILADMLYEESLVDIASATQIRGSNRQVAWDAIGSTNVSVQIVQGESSDIPLPVLGFVKGTDHPWAAEDTNSLYSSIMYYALTHEILKVAALLLDEQSTIPDNPASIDADLSTLGVSPQEFHPYHVYRTKVFETSDRDITLGQSADRRLRYLHGLSNYLQFPRSVEPLQYQGF